MAKYNSLDDYLKSQRLDVDGLLGDSKGAPFSVKGRVIDAAVLFADMTSFSSRSNVLSPVETLIFANNFFAEISAEGLAGRPGIVDKYIGDEMMVVFSKDFGSEDAVADAVDAARWMVENDALGFSPHIGIAAGEVVVGYVGTPLRYDCSVFGAPVVRAQRCCQIQDARGPIALPLLEWGGRKLDQVLSKRKSPALDGAESGVVWKMLPARKGQLKGDPEPIEILELAVAGNTAFASAANIPLDGGPVHSGWLAAAEGRARRGFEALRESGDYNLERYPFEQKPESLSKEQIP